MAAASGGEQLSVVGRHLRITIVEGKDLPTSAEKFIPKVSLHDYSLKRINGPLPCEPQPGGTATATFNQTFEFGEEYQFHDDVLPKIFVELYNKKSWSPFGGDELLGLIEIDTEKTPREKGAKLDKWYRVQAKQLKTKSGKTTVGSLDSKVTDLGQIRIKTSWFQPKGSEERHGAGDLSEFDVADDQLDQDPNSLIVRVISANQLRVMDSSMYGGAADPRVVLKLDGKPVKDWDKKPAVTTVKKKNLQPIWNEEFRIPCYLNKDGSAPLLELIVEDEDVHLGLVSDHDFMGKTTCPLLPLVNHEFKTFNNKLKDESGGNADEKKRGFLQFAVQWYADPTKPAEPLKVNKGIMGSLAAAVGPKAEEIEEVEDAEDARQPKTEDEINKEKEAMAAAQEKLKSELGAMEVKSGDYQIQVHIIEVRELVGKDGTGTSDPVVFVEAFGQKQNTEVHEKTLNCVFDELLIFNKRDLDKEEFEEEVIKVSVMDADTFTRNDLIGAYTVDLSFVYFRENHEIYRTWVGLINDEDVENSGVQGYLKLSIQIVGPGDKLYVHDEAEEKRKEKQLEGEAGGGIAGKIIMPPAIKREIKWLRTTVWRAEYLPIEDESLIGSAGIDAFYEIQQGTSMPCRTKPVTVKGKDRASLSPSFNTELWVPVTVPTSSQTIKGTMNDWDEVVGGLGSFTLVSTSYFKFGELDAMPNQRRGPFWQPLYGAAVGIPTTVKAAIAIEKATATTDWEAHYNKYPDAGSTYRGRVLLSMQIVGKDDAPKRKQVSELRNWRRKFRLVKGNQEPPTDDLVLSAVVISGTELPQKTAVSITNAGANQKMQVQLSCGRFEQRTNKMPNVNGVSDWFRCITTEEEHIAYPKDDAQIPDIFVHLMRGEHGDIANPRLGVSFIRFTAKELIAKGFSAEQPTWVTLKEDKGLNCLADGEFPGNVLLMVGMGSREEWHANRSRWFQIASDAQKRNQYELRAHIYQCRGLPDADFIGGGIDPYLKVNYNGKMERTAHVTHNNDPLIYTSLSFPGISAPQDHRFLPQINVQVWDYDLGPLGDDYIGCFFHEISEEDVLDAAHVEDGDDRVYNSKIPLPKWYPLMREEPGDCEGEVLASFQLIQVRPNQVLEPSPPIIPEFRKCAVEILCIGVRDMVPYNFMPMQFPSLLFEIDGAELRDTAAEKESAGNTLFPVASKMKSKVKEQSSQKQNAGSVLRPITYSAQTKESKKPDAPNANFLERIVMEVQLPTESIFAPPLKITAHDSRLGGFIRPVVGKNNVPLENKCPWSRKYEGPNMESFDMSTGEGAEFVKDEEKKKKFVSPREAAEKAKEAAREAKAKAKKRLTDLKKSKEQREHEAEDEAKAEAEREHAELLKQTEESDVRMRAGSLAQFDEERSSIVDMRLHDAAAGLPDNIHIPVLSEHVDYGGVVKKRFGGEDTGAGVFGALNAAKLLKEAAPGEDSAGIELEEEEEEEEEPKYMKGRHRLPDELEEHMLGTPFETYKLYLGSKFGNELMDPDFREVGLVKGIIRVMESADDPPLIDPAMVLRPQSIKCRVFILTAKGLAAKDMDFFGSGPGKSDPYLYVQLGKELFNGREEHRDDVTDVDFYKVIEMNTEIPGSGILDISVYDWDEIGGDDLIGTTKIDLEDRWFDKRWQAMGHDMRCDDPSQGIRWDAKPLERRNLYTSSAKTPQGVLEMWMELLRPGEAAAFPPEDVSLPPAVEAEVRLIIWKAKDVVAMDTLENMNDLYVTAWVEGTPQQNTDIHWRAAKGKGSWNYRMKFDVSLSHNCKVLKFPYLHIQMWDQDILKWNDIIAETVLDIGGELKKVLRKQELIEVFKDPPKPGVSELESDEEEESDEEVGEDVAEEATSPLLSQADGGFDDHEVKEDEEHDDSVKTQPTAGSGKTKTKKAKKEKPHKTCCQGFAGYFCCCCKGCIGCWSWCPIAPCCPCCMCCWDTTVVDQNARVDEEDKEAMEFIENLKEMAGFGDSKPANSEWLHMDKLDHETGVREPMGRLCISLQLMPKSVSESTPAGFGRCEPNTNPYCPPPTGRLKFSLNPFVMGAQLCGPKICAQITCCLVFIAFVLLLIFCQPFLNLVIAIAAP